MAALLHDLIFESASRFPSHTALKYKASTLTYGQLSERVEQCSRSLMAIGVEKYDRIAIYLPKCLESVIATFGASAAGAVFVPINPALKPHQVSHILLDCDARVLISTRSKYRALEPALAYCVDLQGIILIDGYEDLDLRDISQRLLSWDDLLGLSHPSSGRQVIDADVASLLYTSGSTGEPKGVILSHRNMVTGAKSVAQYLKNDATDRILAVLPLSFDYGMSQLTTTFLVGAGVVLINYLLPMEVLNTLAKERITGMAAVPSLWNLLVQLPWPSEAAKNLRYITSSGGVVPVETTELLRQVLPSTEIFLMYGLTEAFRSTYLPPDQIQRRPTSIGKAIPNAEVLVLKPDGTPCEAEEPGELVHRGSLVAMGYWNDARATEQRFRPVPNRIEALPGREVAAWSGDIVKMDSEGYLYFIGRNDDLIKTSGYRVSPNEIEEVFYGSGLVSEVVALGIPHTTLGQTIALVVVPKPDMAVTGDDLINACKKRLASYMIPAVIEFRAAIPSNPNGKVDRKQLAQEIMESFNE
ncbi:MAG: acyl-CoA ligase (AMP-forming), exosortase A system-associated [Candidatus Thiodiazotropha sp. (ex Dulcina madagascariensis)]|nr:acyl-CoA ligase (AMP-forming), exosortase A system-associated [Candidatus Thiodiazotropha sp. (ex Dulcina madagascariensis)]MCU7926486.1 acyl-CoA ligase (AMP-forming), exosortase A system-associated [Candidatus Thiodiazotropha sp. (ex Dulcina madagascariensis)]